MSSTDCLTSVELSSFLADGLAADARDLCETHLSLCRACRQRLAGMYRASQLEGEPACAPGWLKAQALRLPRQGRVAAPVWIFGYRHQLAGAVAAVLLVAVGVTLFWLMGESGRVGQTPPADVLRHGEETASAPALLAPEAGAALASDQIEFRWSGSPGADGFVFTLMNEKGDIVFQSSTTEQRLVVNAQEGRLERGKTYFWHVGAKSPAGAVADSQIRKFVWGHG